MESISFFLMMSYILHIFVAMPTIWLWWPEQTSYREKDALKKLRRKKKIAAVYTLATPITGLLGLLFLPSLIWCVVKFTELDEAVKNAITMLLFPIHVCVHCIRILKEKSCNWPDCELK